MPFKGKRVIHRTLRRADFQELGMCPAKQEGFPSDSAIENSPAMPGDAGDVGSIPESEIFSGEVHGNPLQDSCLENPMDRGAWWAAIQGSQNNRT